MNHMRKLAHLYHPVLWHEFKSSGCDLLYRTITKFSFLLFYREMAYIWLWNWVQFF